MSHPGLRLTPLHENPLPPSASYIKGFTKLFTPFFNIQNLQLIFPIYFEFVFTAL